MQKQPLISLLLDLEMLNLCAEFNFASRFESWYSCIFFGGYHAFIFRYGLGDQCSRFFVKTVFNRS